MEYFVYQVNSNSSPTIAVEKPTSTFLYDRTGWRKYLTTSERNEFLRAARELPDLERTFCLTLAYTGARISEALFVLPQHVDREAGCIIYETLKRRRRGVFRAVPIPSALMDDLNRVHGLENAQAHNSHDQHRLWPWCRTTAWTLIKNCMAAAEIDGPHASPKGLRHAFAISVLEAGVPINFVRKWLGHARISTTEIYADAVGAEERAMASKFWERF